MRARSKRNGFSLLELVAVVALIGVVAAVTIFRLNNVDKARANANMANENVNLIQAAAERYRFDSGSISPDVTTLVTAGYLPQYPKAPNAGGTYAIDRDGVATYDAGPQR